MNSYRFPPYPSTRLRGNPFGHVATRLTSFVVAAVAVAGLIVASILDGAGLPSGIAVGVAAALFVATAAFATAAVHDSGVARADGNANERPAADVSADHDEPWGTASQLGPDPEQVVSRATGARA
jgi:hypothetical protein